MTFLLASKSDIRARLLHEANIAFEVKVENVDEETIRQSMQAAGAHARDVADKLAETKALRVSMKTPGALVLGCDQVLAFEDQLIGKSTTRIAARDLLCTLRGQSHLLLSAAVLCRDGQAIWRHVSVVRMMMRDFSDEYLDGYLDRNWPDVAGAVGAYHLEGEGPRLFNRIEGDYFSVLGLPLLELLTYLSESREIQA